MSHLETFMFTKFEKHEIEGQHCSYQRMERVKVKTLSHFYEKVHSKSDDKYKKDQSPYDLQICEINEWTPYIIEHVKVTLPKKLYQFEGEREFLGFNLY
jgi:hypothetical protein